MASDSLTKVTRLAKENLALINHVVLLEQGVQLTVEAAYHLDVMLLSTTFPSAHSTLTYTTALCRSFSNGHSSSNFSML